MCLVLAVVIPGGAGADPGVATTGETGFLLQPSARSLDPGVFVLSSGVGAGYAEGRGVLGPGPLSVGVGLPPRLELNVSLRSRGLTRDRRRDLGLVRSGLKVTLAEGGATWPALALDAYADNLLGTGVYGGRLVISSLRSGGVQAGVSAGYHSGRAGVGAGFEAGAAVAYTGGGPLEWLVDVSLEGFRPFGVLVSAGARYQVLPGIALTASLGAAPLGPAGYTANIYLSLFSAPPRPPVAAPTADEASSAPRFTTERPRFRLRVPLTRMPNERRARPVQQESLPADDAALESEPQPADAPGGTP